MLKIVGFLKRRPDITPQQFQAHWRGPHAELGSRIPGLRRYTQNHTRLSAYRDGREPVWDGVVELWFDDESALAESYVTPEWEILREDEPKFLDLSKVAAIPTDERWIVDRPAPPGCVKNISFLTRRKDISVAQFQDYWAHKHGPIASQIPGMRRYVQCHTRASAYEREPAPLYDGVPIAWFENTDAMRGSGDSDAYTRTRADEANFLEPGAITFVIAEEHVILG